MPSVVNWITFAVLCLLTIMLLYEGWVNLVNQKVSRFSIDTFLVYILQKIGTEKTRRNVRNFPRNKAEIIVLGIWALLAGLKVIQEIVNWIEKYKP